MLLKWRLVNSLEHEIWDRLQPVGREFGSADFERLMDEDYRSGSGVFDPALKANKSEPC